jgi:hypothetical protein
VEIAIDQAQDVIAREKPVSFVVDSTCEPTNVVRSRHDQLSKLDNGGPFDLKSHLFAATLEVESHGRFRQQIQVVQLWTQGDSDSARLRICCHGLRCHPNGRRCRPEKETAESRATIRGMKQHAQELIIQFPAQPSDLFPWRRASSRRRS